MGNIHYLTLIISYFHELRVSGNNPWIGLIQDNPLHLLDILPGSSMLLRVDVLVEEKRALNLLGCSREQRELK